MSDRDILTDPQWQAFQRQLDAQPDSHATRAVLADWLEGQGHPWAKAYRWMARLKLYPSPAGWFMLPLTENTYTMDHLLFCLLTRHDAEAIICELFDELPLVGKEDDQPQPRTYEQRAAYCCDVCGNVPDEDSMIEH